MERKSSFPFLITPRLVLRQLQETDAKELALLRSNESVNRYVDRVKQTTIVGARAFITHINRGMAAHQWFYWTLCNKGHPKLIGTICLWNFSDDKTVAEIGYELDPVFQVKGLMNEALQAVVQYSFETLHLSSIEAFTHENNTSSIQLLLKNNFKLDSERKDKENENNVIYVLKAEDYR